MKRGCYACKAKHHSSLCEKEIDEKGSVLTGFTPSVEETLPPILPVRIEGKVIWGFPYTGSGRNFTSKNATRMLKSKLGRYMTRVVTTINGTRRKAMPIFNVNIESLDKEAREGIEIAGAEMNDFTAMRRPDLRRLKQQFAHTKDKEFYLTASGEHQIQMIIGDKKYSNLRTEAVFKGKYDEPIVEGATFGWVIHGAWGRIYWHKFASSSESMEMIMRDYIALKYLGLKTGEKMTK